MPFDINTAQPVKNTAFDINTAQPSDLQGQALTSEKTQIKAQSEKRIAELQADLDKLNQVRNDPGLVEQVFGGIEGFLALASPAVAEPVAGIVGLADAANPFAEEGAGANRVKQVRDALTFKPKLRAGEQAVEPVVKALEPIGKGLQDLRTAVGDDALNATGSEFLASIATALPDATLALLPGKSLLNKPKALQGQGQSIALADKIKSPTTNVLKKPLNVNARATTQASAQQSATKAINQPFSKLQSPAKQKLSELIVKGSDDADVAGFKLSTNTLKSKIIDGLPRIVKDKIAQKAINQGLDPATVAMVKSSNKLEKFNFNKMLSIAEKSLKNRKFRAENRVGDVAGESLLSRINHVKRINQRSGGDINKVASSTLRNKTVDMTSIAKSFSESLKKIDAKLSKDGQLINFKGSTLEGKIKGASTARNSLKVVLKRMNQAGVKNNALKLHKLKRLIDTQVSFGKTSTGSAGAAEGALKSLRRQIDGVLDSQFPQYKKVNDVFSQTRDALDDFQKASGRNLNLLGDQADKALGVKLRSLTNNTQARANLMAAMSKIEDVAIKNGVKFKDRILEQVLFADDLESLLKISPKNAFKGQITEAALDATTGSTVQAGLKAGKTLKDKLTGKTPENAIKAIKELLKESN